MIEFGFSMMKYTCNRHFYDGHSVMLRKRTLVTVRIYPHCEDIYPLHIWSRKTRFYPLVVCTLVIHNVFHERVSVELTD